jgi:hypothetical protein
LLPDDGRPGRTGLRSPFVVLENGRGLFPSPSLIDGQMPALPPISAAVDRCLAAWLLFPVRTVARRPNRPNNSSGTGCRAHRIPALASAAQINPERLRDRAREALVAYANAFTEGNRTAVADMAGCGRGVFYSWFKDDQAPRIDTLLRTWYQLKLPVAYLVDGNCPGAPPELRAEGIA